MAAEGQVRQARASGLTHVRNAELSSDELQDEQEIRDPKVKRAIREGYQEFLAGKTRSISEFLAARSGQSKKRRSSGA